eukprot:15481315-Alexandrium_andersonii.AAC.1
MPRQLWCCRRTRACVPSALSIFASTADRRGTKANRHAIVRRTDNPHLVSGPARFTRAHVASGMLMQISVQGHACSYVGIQ